MSDKLLHGAEAAESLTARIYSVNENELRRLRLCWALRDYNEKVRRQRRIANKLKRKK